METADLLPLVEHLEDNIDVLEESLEPLLAAALSATTKSLPVLDRAKLYVLIVYSIESLLFSYLRLNGVQAKEHPVFKELTRVKQYFEKIKIAEAGPTKPRENISLNKQAAGRVIRHALAGNDKYDLERAEREAREKLLARRKLNKFIEKKMPQEQAQDIDESRKDVEVQDDSESESETSSEVDGRQDAVMADAETDSQQATTDTPIKSNAPGGGLSRSRRYRDKKERKHKTLKAASAPITTVEGQAQSSGRKRKKRKKKKKSWGKREATLGGEAGGFP